MKNHLINPNLQPRGLVALLTALGLFHSVWSEMEILLKNVDIEDDRLFNKGINNDINNNNNNKNDYSNIDNNYNIIEVNNKNKIKNPSSSQSSISSLSLSHSFDLALERSSAELSGAEMFQVNQRNFYFLFLLFFIYLFIYLFVCLFVFLFVCLFVYLLTFKYIYNKLYI